MEGPTRVPGSGFQKLTGSVRLNRLVATALVFSLFFFFFSSNF